MSPLGHVLCAYVDIPLDTRDAAYSVDLRSRKMDARNGVTRQRLSETALLSSEQAARPEAVTGGMAQEANAQGNAWDTLT